MEAVVGAGTAAAGLACAWLASRAMLQGILALTFRRRP
jgi:hypothetical protein